MSDQENNEQIQDDSAENAESIVEQKTETEESDSVAEDSSENSSSEELISETLEPEDAETQGAELEESESKESESKESELKESDSDSCDEVENSEAKEVKVSVPLTDEKLKNILEAALMAMGKPMSVDQLMRLFEGDETPTSARVKSALQSLQEDCEGRGIELKEVATGYRYQSRQEYSDWLGRLWEEKPAKYSRAFLETLALIAYRQPVTRAEIEEVRGVSVSSYIVKSMLEREWIRVVGHRDVPGRPSLYATTKQFLDYFNMKSLDELPSLAEIKDLEDLNPELALETPQDEGNEEALDAESIDGNMSEGNMSEGSEDPEQSEFQDDEDDLSDENGGLEETPIEDFMGDDSLEDIPSDDGVDSEISSESVTSQYVEEALGEVTEEAYELSETAESSEAAESTEVISPSTNPEDSTEPFMTESTIEPELEVELSESEALEETVENLLDGESSADLDDSDKDTN